MQVSENGLDFLKNVEGFNPFVYKDAAGYKTIGYGHKLKADERFPLGITKDQATALLLADVGVAVASVNRLVTVPITQNEFDALVSFAFNVGAHALEESTLLILLNEGKAAEAGEQFERWNHADGKVVAGLTKRREAERELFISGSTGI